jgi:hypothetical protein
MTGPTYPAARIVANRLAAAPSKPDAACVEEIITIAFWASLRREEGHAPRFSLAFVPPEQSLRPVQLNPRIRLEPNLLVRLAPAVEKPAMHIGVWPFDGDLYVWGVTRTVPARSLIFEVVEPGLLVVKYRRDDPTAKFANVAVLEGADVKFIEQQPAAMSEAPAALGSLLAFYTSGGRRESDAILMRIAMAMRAHGRGGSLLVVPRDTHFWKNSIVQPITYTLIPPFPDIGTFLQHSQDDTEASPITLQYAVNALAGLTAVDGATIISDYFEPLAFGAKILTRDRVRRVDEVLLTEPIEGVADITLDPAQMGGTRHLSAAQFAHDQRDAVALVASQDGQFTVFAWSAVKNIVHAHRLDALLI